MYDIAIQVLQWKQTPTPWKQFERIPCLQMWPRHLTVVYSGKAWRAKSQKIQRSLPGSMLMTGSPRTVVRLLTPIHGKVVVCQTVSGSYLWMGRGLIAWYYISMQHHTGQPFGISMRKITCVQNSKSFWTPYGQTNGFKWHLLNCSFCWINSVFELKNSKDM